jgi:hypothetical protein
MSQHIARIEFIWEGAKIEGIQSIEDTETDHGTRVPTLDGDGYAEVVGSLGLNIEYALPLKGKPFDFTKTKTTPANATVYYLGGGKRIYRGLQLLKEGASKADGKTAKTVPMEFMCTSRTDK